MKKKFLSCLFNRYGILLPGSYLGFKIRYNSNQQKTISDTKEAQNSI